MKTLRQYVVNGGLFAGDGKTPAAVGDQVRLYLDTEAHADFPEYIVGTIQHPVAPILAGTAISYSFEYDEADLDGVVANLIIADVISVTVTSAVDIVAEEVDALTAVVATKQPLDSDLTAYANAADAAARRALIGAEPETTESVLSLLDGETVVLDGIIIPDQGDLVPVTEGALIRNGNSLAWAQDPDDAIPGGSIIYDESESFGGVKIAAASYAANTRQILGSIVIPARYAVPDQLLKVSLSYSIYGNSAALPAGTTLGLVTENRKVLGANTVGAIYGWALQEQIHQQVNNFNFQVKLLVDTDPTKVYLANPSASALITSTRPLVHGTTGNVTVVNDPLNPDELSFDAERSLTLIDDAFVIYLVLDIPASATPSTSIEVGYSMKIRGY